MLPAILAALFLGSGTLVGLAIGRGARHMEEAAQSVVTMWISSGVAGLLASYALVRGGIAARILGLLVLIAAVVVTVFGVSWISPL